MINIYRTPRLIYKHLVPDMPKIPWCKFALCHDVIPRDDFVICLTVLDRLRTKAWLFMRKLIAKDVCMLCGLHSETRSHLFSECEFTWNTCMVFFSLIPMPLVCKLWEEWVV